MFLLSKFMGKSFAIWAAFAALVAFFCPQNFVVLEPYLPFFQAFVMFGLGFLFDPQHFAVLFRHPGQLFMGVLGQFLIMPGLAFLITLTFKMPPEIALGIMIIGCCPGGTTSNIMTFLARGNAPLSITLTNASMLFAPFATPFLLKNFVGRWVEVSFSAMTATVLLSVVLPVICGMVVKKMAAKAIVHLLPSMSFLSGLCVILVLSASVAVHEEVIRSIGLFVVFLVILHNLLGHLLGFLVARFSGLSLSQQKAIAIEVGMQNSTLGIAVAHANFSSLSAVPCAFFGIWNNFSVTVIAQLFRYLDDQKVKQEAVRIQQIPRGETNVFRQIKTAS